MKINSPMALGQRVQTNAPAVDAQPETDTAPEAIEPDEVFIKSSWPDGFSVINGALHKAMTDPDTGIVKNVRFCNTSFYPLWHVYNAANECSFEIEYITVHGEKRRLFMPTSEMSSTDKLAATLASRTLFLEGKGGRAMAQELLAKLSDRISWKKREKRTEVAFGWDKEFNSFVIGRTRITADGEKEVLLDEHVRNGRMDKDFGVAGNRAKWATLVNEVYNRPGAEAYQFAFLVAAAAPLVSLVNIKGFRGIPVAYTGKGGRGKTTLCAMACSIWGDGLNFKQSSNEDGATINALVAKMGIMRHLPWIMDEMTGQKTEAIAGMLYAMSNGQPKERLTSSGTFAGNGSEWDTFSFITGNMDISGLLSGLDAQKSDAVAVRCFEIQVPDDYNEKVFKGMDAKVLIDKELAQNYGAVGRELIRYYIKHRGAIVNAVHTLRQKYTATTADETRERFYVDLICFALVAGHIMQKLGLIQFDLKAIKRWAMSNVMALREKRREKSYTEEEYIGHFISSLYDKTIQTKRIADVRKKESAEIPIVTPRCPPEARIAFEAKRFLVTARGLNEWCKESGVSAAFLRDALDRQGYLEHRSGEKDLTKIFRIGQGTTVTTGVGRCYELDYAKVMGELKLEAAGNVTKIVNPDGKTGTNQ